MRAEDQIDRGLRAVVVDDEKFIRVLMSRLLGRLGIEVVGSAACTAEAVALCGQHRPDLVTLDIAMPGEDGLEALRRIRALDPSITVVMSTALADRSRMAAAVRAGAAGYLVKPFDLASIRTKLARLFPAC